MKDPTRTTSRREFLRAGATIAAVAWTGCKVFIGNRSTDAKTKPVGASVTLPLERYPKLARPGGQINVEVAGQPSNVLVFRRADGQLGALSIECTHAGCDVDYVPETDNVQCPCHGSGFAVTGEVTEGPAREPLR